MERARYVVALLYQALAVATAGKVGQYLSMSECAKLIFVVVIDTLAAGESVICTVVEAQDAAATGAQNITTATCTVVANTNVRRAQVTMNSPDVDDTVTINGILFTAKAAQTLATRQFDQSGSTTAQATSLAACINDATYGVPGVTAVASTAVVILTPDAPEDTTITVSTSDAVKTVPATLDAVALIEVDASALSDTFTHVAIRVAGPTSAHAVALAEQSDLRYMPMVQPVAAQDADF